VIGTLLVYPPKTTETPVVAGKTNSNRTKKTAVVALLLFAMQTLIAAAVFAQSSNVPYNSNYQNTSAPITMPSGTTIPGTSQYYYPSVDWANGINNGAPQNVNGGGNAGDGISRNVDKLLTRNNAFMHASQQPPNQQPAVFVPQNFSDPANDNGQQVQQQTQALNDFNQQWQQQQNTPLQMPTTDAATGASNTLGQLTSLFDQSAEQIPGGGTTNNPQLDTQNLFNSNLGQINETYRGMTQWWNDDIVGNLFGQIGQLIGKWISELIDGWVAGAVQFLASFLRTFVLNPNIAVNGLNGSQPDGISAYVRQGADVMYGIACDLLLLMFILAIWKYWAEASWRGAGNLMGAVGRLIFTAGLLLAFPTLYAFEIQITNEMIKAIYFNSTDQIAALDALLASAVRGGIIAGVGGLASAFAPLLGGAAAGAPLYVVGEVIAFVGLVVFLILGFVLLAELVYILVLKAIQTALLTAQYMFAPIFLVFFATPDTENVATGFIRAWVETSLWTFFWVGLLKIMVIICMSDYNPWGKILMSVGVLQIMIQVPTFLARAQISPMSDFISAGVISTGLLKMFGWMGKTAASRTQQLGGWFLNDKIGQRGFAQTTKNSVGGLPEQSGAAYDRMKTLKDRATGADKDKFSPKDQNLKSMNRQKDAMRPDKDGLMTDPQTGKKIGFDQNGNLVDAKTGQPLSRDDMQRLGFASPPPKGQQNTPHPGLQRGINGKLFDPRTGEEFEQNPKTNNIIDPKTGKDMTAAKAASMGLTRDGKALAIGGALAALGGAGSGRWKDAQGNKFQTDPTDNKLIGADGKKTGFSVDPATGELKDDKGKQLSATERDKVLANIKNGPAAGPNQHGAEASNREMEELKKALGEHGMAPSPALKNPKPGTAEAFRAAVKKVGLAAAIAGLGGAAMAVATAGNANSAANANEPPKKDGQLTLPGLEEHENQVKGKGQAIVTPDGVKGADKNPGAVDAAHLDKGLAGAVAKGLTKEEAQKFRAAWERTKSLSKAATESGLSLDKQALIGAAMTAAAAGGPPGGKTADGQITMPGMEEAAGGAGKATVEADKVAPFTDAGLGRAKDLRAAVNGMVTRGELSKEKGAQLLTAVAQGKSAHDAWAAIGMGAIAGAAAGAAAAKANPDQMLIPGMNETHEKNVQAGTDMRGNAGFTDSGLTTAASAKPALDSMVKGGKLSEAGRGVVMDQLARGKSMEQAMTAARGVETRSGLDLGGLKADSPNVTQDGLRNVEQADRGLKEALARGDINAHQNQVIRSEMAQGAPHLMAAALAGAAGAKLGEAFAARAQHANATINSEAAYRANPTMQTGQTTTNTTGLQGAGPSGTVPPSQQFTGQTLTGQFNQPYTVTYGQNATAHTQGNAQQGNVQQALGALGQGSQNPIPGSGAPTVDNVLKQAYDNRASQQGNTIRNANFNNSHAAQVDRLTDGQKALYYNWLKEGVPPEHALAHANGSLAALELASSRSGGGGGGGRGPNGLEEATKRLPYLENPTYSGWDTAGWWMVAGARAPVGDIRALKVQLRHNQGDNGKVWGSTRGGYNRIDLPNGATPAQVGGMFAVAGFSNEINNDPTAMDAAREAAVQEGYHRPKGFWQGLAANINQAYGGTWAQTALGKAQFQNAMYSSAVHGSESYIKGQQGNAYTQYLRNRYGVWDQEKADSLTLFATDPEAAESAWNAGITQATDRLIASGTKISAAARGAALNPYVAGLRPNAAGSAIRAMIMYHENDPRMQAAAAEKGETTASYIKSPEGGMLLGEICRAMNPEEARTVHEMFSKTGGSDINPHVASAVGGLAAQNQGMSAAVAYSALSNNVGGVAASVSGRGIMRGARNFDQVRQLCLSEFGPENGPVMYNDIVRIAAENAQMKTQAMGRTVVDPDVGALHTNFIEQNGGFAQLADPNNYQARESLQTANLAVGKAVGVFGSRATPKAVNAVYKYINDGNTNIKDMSAQEIIVAEKLIDAGAPKLSQNMVQAYRHIEQAQRIDPSVPNITLDTLQDITAGVDTGMYRADMSAHALKVHSALGGLITKPAVEVAATLSAADAYSPETFHAVYNLVSTGVVQQASTAASVFSMAVQSSARSAGIDPSQGVSQVLQQLEVQSGGLTNAGSIAADISNIKVSGNFEDRQLVDPVLFDAAYDAIHDPTASAHKLQAIRITERIHGHNNLDNQGVINVYDNLLEAGVQPRDLTDDYVGLQRYYAAAALMEARGTYGAPSGKSRAPQLNTRTLDRIRMDERFVMRNARPGNPPQLNKDLWDELWM
jgi:hypothetical protein